MFFFRERPYTVPGKCDLVPDTLCHIGSESDLIEQLNLPVFFNIQKKAFCYFCTKHISYIPITQISLADETDATTGLVVRIAWQVKTAREDR